MRTSQMMLGEHSELLGDDLATTIASLSAGDDRHGKASGGLKSTIEWWVLRLSRTDQVEGLVHPAPADAVVVLPVPVRSDVVLAAAVAVSALVLPGLSGAFRLLTVGLYEPPLSVVSDAASPPWAVRAGGRHRPRVDRYGAAVAAGAPATDHVGGPDRCDGRQPAGAVAVAGRRSDAARAG